MIYAIVDTAADTRLHRLVTATPDHMCLFAGPLRTVVERNAPYVVDTGSAVGLLDAWKTYGWGRNWGIFCRSNRTLIEIRRELRRFLQAELPDGQIVLFRFYDPRVWQTYIRGLNQSQLVQWFGAASTYYTEAEEPGWVLQYDLESQQIVTTQRRVFELF